MLPGLLKVGIMKRYKMLNEGDRSGRGARVKGMQSGGVKEERDGFLTG